MKKILIILILILSSCGLKQKNLTNNNDFKDESIVCEDLSGIDDQIKDYEIFYDTILSNLTVSSSLDLKVNQSDNKKNNLKEKGNNPPAEVTITDDTNPLDTTSGIIAYSFPTKMVVGKKYKIKVRITKSRSEKTVLVIGDRNIPINDVDIDSKVKIEDIRVDGVMSAKLIGDESSFSITQLSSELQNIDDGGYTEWSWLVTPLKSGEVYLKLIIKVRIDNDVKRDIVVFDKKLDIEPDRVWSFKTWFGKYWQWLLSTIIIPILVWLYKRKRKD
jgi:hypothetical protein